jgi:hypothetical protein
MGRDVFSAARVLILDAAGRVDQDLHLGASVRVPAADLGHG